MDANVADLMAVMRTVSCCCWILRLRQIGKQFLNWCFVVVKVLWNIFPKKKSVLNGGFKFIANLIHIFPTNKRWRMLVFITFFSKEIISIILGTLKEFMVQNIHGRKSYSGREFIWLSSTRSATQFCKKRSYSADLLFGSACC